LENPIPFDILRNHAYRGSSVKKVPAALSALLLSLILAPGPVTPGSLPDDVQAVLKKIDELYRSGSSRAAVEMEITTPHWKRTLKMRFWSEGMDKTFIRIDEPLKEQGVATLRVGNEMWNYLPKTDKVLKVPPSMMMSSWMGSDFTNDDLVKEYTFLDDYTFEEAAVETPDRALVYIRCVPREGVPVVWGHILVAARKSDSLPVWERFFDERGDLMREMRFEDVKPLGGRTIPTTLVLEPKTKGGYRTVLRYTEAAFDVSLAPDIFTLRNLRSGE
jgi:outer membrane lipoprotein-sorting protein